MFNGDGGVGSEGGEWMVLSPIINIYHKWTSGRVICIHMYFFFYRIVTK